MRTEIIEILQKAYPEYCLKHIDTANKILRLFEKNQVANEWISVHDKLPENETYINLKLKNGDLTSIFYETKSDLMMLKIHYTHWKPIN